MNVASEIAPLIATLAAGRRPEPGCCRTWTQAHIEAVRFHQLAPWLYVQLRDRHEADLAADQLRSMERDYGLSSIMSRVRDQSLRRVLEAFEGSSVPVVLLKGAYLARSVYEDTGLRMMCDVDLLTPEKDFERAAQELSDLGYTVAGEALYEDGVSSPPAMAFRKPDQPFDAVDLHRALWGIDYYRLPSSVLWRHAVETRLHGCKVYFFTPELNFIHLAMHTLNHSYLLRNWLDLVLLGNRTSLDWDRLIDVAGQLKAVRPVYWAVKELRRSWGWRVPQPVEERLSSYEPHWLEDRVIHGRFRYGWRLCAKLKHVNGWRPRLTYARSKIIPSRAYREAFGGNSGLLTYWGALLKHVARKVTFG